MKTKIKLSCKALARCMAQAGAQDTTSHYLNSDSQYTEEYMAPGE